MTWHVIYIGRGQTDVLIMDFSKAFDKVGHQRVIKKLDSNGVRDKTRDWIHAFLADRTLQVVVRDKFSDIAQMQSGVPQGSVFFPISLNKFLHNGKNLGYLDS